MATTSTWCPDCDAYTNTAHTHVEPQPLVPVYNNNSRTYPISLRINPPNSFSEGFGGVLGVAAGLWLASVLFGPRR